MNMSSKVLRLKVAEKLGIFMSITSSYSSNSNPWRSCHLLVKRKISQNPAVVIASPMEQEMMSQLFYFFITAAFPLQYIYTGDPRGSHRKIPRPRLPSLGTVFSIKGVGYIRKVTPNWEVRLDYNFILLQATTYYFLFFLIP